MMEEISKIEADLLNYLRGLGFEGDQLGAEIRRNVKLELPVFNARHSIDFGAEQVNYRLLFVRDLQFQGYRLDKYVAFYKAAIPIKDTKLEGIDSTALDELMAKVHWPLYFKGGNVPGSNNNENAREATGQLNKLIASKDAEANRLADQLIYKYWPRDQQTTDQQELFDSTYQKQRYFDPSRHAIIAYQILSGRLDDLYEKVRLSGMDDLPGFELYQSLAIHLKTNPSSFTLETEYNTSEGHTWFKLPITEIEGCYSFESYTATTALFPPIEYGLHHGVDTWVLENEMRAIDWKNDGNLFVFNDDREPDFQPPVEKIAKQMNILSEHEDSRAIYDLLSLKYWQNVAFFEDFIREEAWELLDRLPSNTMEFQADLDYRATINLLSGRPIFEHFLFPFEKETANWVRLDLDKLGNENAYPYIHIQGQSKEELEAVLQMLPVRPNRFSPFLPQLIRGDLIPAILYNNKKVLLVANPELKTIDVFSTEGRQIPVNIHFDPDWKQTELPRGLSPIPSQDGQQKTPEKPNKPPPKPTKRNGLK